jgi:AraC-like DNA-binding protein
MKGRKASKTLKGRGKRTDADERIIAGLEVKGFSALGLIELFDRVENAGFWIKDTQGRFLWVNTAFLLHNGMHKRTEVLGLTDFDLCSPALAAQYVQDDKEVLKGTRIASRIEMIGRFDHSMTWVVTSKIPMGNRRGRIIGTAGLSHAFPQGMSAVPENSPLAAAMRFISEKFREQFDVDELARLCGMSRRAFHRKFREAYRASPHEYVRSVRVRASCHALVFSRKDLASIADEFGFSDQSHFTREFRRLMGETPGAYRLHHRK